MEKTFYPGKIMYSAINANVVVVQLLRQEGGMFYVRGLFNNGEWSHPYMQYSISYYHNTREEAFCQALEQLSESVKALPSVDELRAIEKSYNVGK